MAERWTSNNLAGHIVRTGKVPPGVVIDDACLRKVARLVARGVDFGPAETRAERLDNALAKLRALHPAFERLTGAVQPRLIDGDPDADRGARSHPDPIVRVGVIRKGRPA